MGSGRGSGRGSGTNGGSEERAEVVVIGAGLAGLACARILVSQGVDVRVLERADAVGGRVRTDEVDGYLLDRGFQVILTAYEELRAHVDLDRLELRAFDPGSVVRRDREFHRLADPFRAPLKGLASAAAPVGSLGEKLRVARLRSRLLSGDPPLSGRSPPQSADPDRTTEADLRARGFSEDFIDAFFRSFLGGVFLERELETSARLFRYYFRCFAAGEAAVPARGMQRLPEAMAELLGDRIRLNTTVGSADGRGVTLTGGHRIAADQVVLATDAAAAAAILGEDSDVEYKVGLTTWYAADEAPVDDPSLVLDGDGEGPYNHLAVMSRVSEAYAPPGRHLIAASAVGPHARNPAGLDTAGRAQLEAWFGPAVREWRALRTHRIPHALPRHPPGTLDDSAAGTRHPSGVVLAGDHTAFGSLQGALLSGRRAAERVLDG